MIGPLLLKLAGLVGQCEEAAEHSQVFRQLCKDPKDKLTRPRLSGKFTQ
jgi:hypothetical protein